MTKQTLYKYKRDNGGITVSINKPLNKSYKEIILLIADEYKGLTKNGVDIYISVLDDGTEDWYEVDYLENEK